MITFINSFLDFFSNIPPSLIALLCGFTCGLLGPFFVWRNLSFLSDAIAHSSLTPLAIAVPLGISPLLLVFPFNIILALLLTFLAYNRPLNLDSYISVIFAGFMGLGLMISQLTGNSGEELLHILFGNIYSPSSLNSFLTVFVSIAVIGHIIYWRKEVFLTMLNRDLAAIDGVNAKWHEGCLLVLLSIVVTVGIKLMGTVLLTALIVTPTVVTRPFARSLHSQLILSSSFGAVVAGLGVFIADRHNLPVSGFVATLCLGFFILSLRFKPMIN